MWMLISHKGGCCELLSLLPPFSAMTTMCPYTKTHTFSHTHSVNQRVADALQAYLLSVNRKKTSLWWNKCVLSRSKRRSFTNSIKLYRNGHCCLVQQCFWMRLLMCVESSSKLVWLVKHAFDGFPEKQCAALYFFSFFFFLSSFFFFTIPDVILFWMDLCSNKVICLVQRQKGSIVVIPWAGDKCERLRLCQRKEFMQSGLSPFCVRWRKKNLSEKRGN